ncbi:MAG: hypothetical protein AAF368_05515 [Planctomycetota bacterium]
MKTSIRTVLACALPLTTAHAQSMNIDFGDPLSAFGVPATTYSAASTQAGVWNAIGEGPTFDYTTAGLLDLAGMPTAVGLSMTGIVGDFDFDNLNTMGDDAALLDDLADATASSVNFTGLADGNYQIYTYAFAPDDPTQITTVTAGSATSTMVGGVDWTGSFVEGETHAIQCVQVVGGTLSVQLDVVLDFGSINGIQLIMDGVCTGGNLVPYCFGDGSGTPCPCGNNSTAGHPGGCANSAGNGAILTATGNPSVAMDSLNLDLESASLNSFALLVSGDNQLPQMGACMGCGNPAFDGLRCAGGGFLRHGSRATNAMGETGNGWGPPGGPAGGLIAANGFVAGQTKNFFAFYREDQALVCFTGQNSSNGVAVTFVP